MRSIRINRIVVTVLTHLGLAAAPCLAAETAALPGGASSLQESYQDWTVICAIQATVKRCAMTQQQTDPQSRQRILAIEFNSVAADKISGELVLPFGLALENGVALQIDDTPPGTSLRFRTCLAAGCVVPLTIDTKVLALLKKGTGIKVKTTADGGGAADFNISLKGFVAALDRTSMLAR
jgi:invasion protein IalB